MIDVPRSIVLHQPRKLSVGGGCFADCAADLAARGARRVFVVTAAFAREAALQAAPAGADVVVWDQVNSEPTVATFAAALAAARAFRPDAVVGLGGGSPLDVAKLVAALVDADQPIAAALGIDKLAGRSTYLACVPTTAGTGSEVSPNAILLDEADQLKKGVISPHLVPDAAYVDPTLTHTVPPDVTAATGLDALTHCVEAYVNRLAHPLVDLFALDGVRRIGRSLAAAVEHPNDAAARADVALGSLYGGLCLGPVNTGAVHALSYPLGGEFHVPHGVANAILLPHVLRFNLPAAPNKYAAVAAALGVEGAARPLDTAARGVEFLQHLSRRCGVPQRLRDVGVTEAAVPRLARAAMTVTRLLDRNVRAVTEADAVGIYREAL